MDLFANAVFAGMSGLAVQHQQQQVGKCKAENLSNFTAASTGSPYSEVVMKLSYTVLAGKPDSDEHGQYCENIKFCDDAESFEAAQQIIADQQLYTYPICRVEVTGFTQ